MSSDHGEGGRGTEALAVSQSECISRDVAVAQGRVFTSTQDVLGSAPSGI